MEAQGRVSVEKVEKIMVWRYTLKVASASEDVDGVEGTKFKSKNDIKIKDWHKVIV